MPAYDYITIPGQLGKIADGNKCYEGEGSGIHNKDGERITDFPGFHESAFVNI